MASPCAGFFYDWYLLKRFEALLIKKAVRKNCREQFFTTQLLGCKLLGSRRQNTEMYFAIPLGVPYKYLKRLEILEQNKNEVLMLSCERRLVGFTTLQIYPYEWYGQVLRIVYSGDTVVDKPHWGQQAFSGIKGVSSSTSRYKLSTYSRCEVIQLHSGYTEKKATPTQDVQMPYIFQACLVFA